MKKINSLFLLLIAILPCCAQEIKETRSNRNISDYYTTLGGMYNLDDQTSDKEPIPAVSFGKKVISETGNGIDFGFTVAYRDRKYTERREYNWQEESEYYTYTTRKPDFVVLFPRAEYMHYFKGFSQKMNLYCGVGGSFGKTRFNENKFTGIMMNTTLGLEFFREKKMNGFTQLKVFAPILSASSGSTRNTLLSLGRDSFGLMQFDMGLGF